MHWPFAKYVACGNDFVLFDNRQGTFPLTEIELIQTLCHRQYGIGADGILLVENSSHADCRMRIFNSDGSEAEMCGNGLRCVAQWLISQGCQSPFYQVELMHQTLVVSQCKEAICIEMGEVSDVRWNIPLPFEKEILHLHYLDTGVPHVVLFVKDVASIDLLKIGKAIRSHSFWQPGGTNVTIAQQMAPQRLKIRTYERGVEGETLACGTGATAAALAAAYQYSLSHPIVIQTCAGEELKVGFSFQKQQFSHVTLTGSAHCVFQGEIDF